MKNSTTFLIFFVFLLNLNVAIGQDYSNSVGYSPAISIGSKQETLFSEFSYSKRIGEVFGISLEMGNLAAYYQPSENVEELRALESIQTYSICPEFRLFNENNNLNFYFNAGPSLIRWHRMNIIYLSSSNIDFIDPPVWYLLGYKAEVGLEFKLFESIFLSTNVAFYNYIHNDELYGMTQRVLINFGTGISYKF